MKIKLTSPNHSADSAHIVALDGFDQLTLLLDVVD